VGVAYIRTVKTASRAIAVRIAHSNRRGSREIDHIGSGHTPEDVEVLKALARQRLHAGQDTNLADGKMTAAQIGQVQQDHDRGNERAEVDPLPFIV
jgi:hypothetical protein